MNPYDHTPEEPPRMPADPSPWPSLLIVATVLTIAIITLILGLD